MQLLGVIVEERGSLYIVTEYMAKVSQPHFCCGHMTVLATPSQVELCCLSVDICLYLQMSMFDCPQSL